MQLQPGAKLGGYRILSHLTKGGMGSLYVARKDGPGGFERDVVLKVVHKELSIDDEFVRLFLQEARLSALIRHPNVVHVEDLGQEGATYFIVMELFDGVSLSRVLKRMRKRNVEMAIPIAVHIACAVAEGLHAAHRTTDRQGRPLEIVHRDATPHNVLVGRTGHVKLIDFGIAKARNATVYTQKGMVRGKIAYLAPEQVWGRPVDRRTDVYALGALLYEMLAGRRLVTAESQAELFAKVREPDHPPIRVFRQVPPALDQVVMTALSPSPDQRYRTARDMRDALLEACPDAAKIHAEDLAPLVLEMADKELNALRRVIRSAHSQAPPPSPAPTPGPPADAPPQPMAASAQSEVPTTHEPIPPTVGQAMQLPDTDASLRAAGIDPRGNAAQAVKTMPIPLVSPEPSPSSGPRQRVETAPAPGAIPRTRMETGSGTTTASRSGPRPLRFSKEVELDQQAIERARLASKRKRRKRIIIALAIVTPFLGAALVVGVMLLRSFVR